MEAKEKIIEILKNYGELSTSRIAGTIGIDYNYATKLLEELLDEKKVIKIMTPNSTYWKIMEMENVI